MALSRTWLSRAERGARGVVENRRRTTKSSNEGPAKRSRARVPRRPGLKPKRRSPGASSSKSTLTRRQSSVRTLESGGTAADKSPKLRPKRRRSSKEVERPGASSPRRVGASSPTLRPKRRRSSAASSPRAKRRSLRDEVESTAGASSSGLQPRSDQIQSIQEFVGPSTETREAHLLRHGGGQLTCPRCRYYVHGTAWTATYGSCMAPTGPRRRIVWLAERPARLGDAWALGCVFCASFVCRLAKGRHWPASTGRRGGFCGYRVRHRALQVQNIRNHASSQVHKFAEASWFRPDEPVCIAL